MCDFKHHTQDIGHTKHYFKSSLEKHWGYPDYGPILAHDTDAKYTKADGGAQDIKIIFKSEEIEHYEKTLKLGKRKRDKKTNDKAAAVSRRQKKMVGEYLAAKICFDWVFFFGAKIITEQLNATQNGFIDKELYLCIWLMGASEWKSI